MNVGKTVDAIAEKDKNVTMSVAWYTMEFYNSNNGGKDVSKAFGELFKSLHMPHLYGRQETLTASGGTASDRYNIRADVYESLCGVIKSLGVQQKEFREKVDTYRKVLDEEFREKKNDIYNEGVEKGRQLLFQLNDGGIGMEDFGKRINRF